MRWCAIKILLVRPTSLVLMLFVCTTATNAQRSRTPYSTGEILVKFKNGINSETVSSLVANLNGTPVETLGDLGWRRIAIPKGESVETAILQYQKLPLVEAAQPNFYYSLLATPNDPQFTESTMYGLFKVSAPQAWDIATGSSTVVIADIDTGIRYTHEDLAANMWINSGEIQGNNIDDEGNGFIDDVYGYDFRYNDPDPVDELSGFGGHGTHTAGTLGAVGNNGVGVVGINWNVKLMAIKIYSAAANDTTSAMLINAYNYVRMMKNRGVNIRVTNNSYGGCAETCGHDQATKDAIDALGDAGILNVFAAGNAGANIETTPFYPASYTSPSILSVAASNVADNKAQFSNFGPVSVDIAAPGTGIYSTTSASDSSYVLMGGTSMATPHVAGAAALLAGHNPALSSASLKATLLNTVDVLPQWNGIVKTGGRLNIFSALQNPTVCSLGLASDNILVPTKGGLITVNVTAAANCDYTVKSNVNWIVHYGDAARSSNSTLNLWVRINPTINRAGTVRIGDRTLTIRQSRGGNL